MSTFFDEFEQTRKILETIRNSNLSNKNRIVEQTEEVVDTTITTEKDVQTKDDVIELDQDQRKEEEKKFREIISPRVSFNRFLIYPKSGNAEWSGVFQDSRIEWVYSLDDTRGVYITTNLLRLDDGTLETIKKLVGFYDTWADTWANKIADEYRKIDSDDE